MVEFLSVLIGLYTGVHVVELGVVGEVAAIEIRLDGTSLTTLSGPPWEFECDFGPTPAPHELVAIARGSAGHEIDRATRWVNLADSTSAAAMKLSTSSSGIKSTTVRTFSESFNLCIISEYFRKLIPRGTAPATINKTLGTRDRILFKASRRTSRPDD